MTRCAIYTRKSSEEGLEQAFNSLDAQREACEAFIVSQKHEGWSVLPEFYDDGGISGGTMNRPALQRLLADIAGGRVDVVVVYKVDRLTRSLADFAKIVEAFDAKGVSFVSVTQQFNTTTSMGRLTLNVLLSFAQFEREVTGERIRDKIAASKRKGMWMGGRVPLGYDIQDRALVVNESEATIVRHIFRRYAELGSVHALKAELDADGVVGKHRIDRFGRPGGGKPFTRGALYLLVQNRLYRGDIAHKGAVYPGQHDAIVDADLWERCQERIASNRVDRATGTGIAAPSLLMGLVHDDAGVRMTPTHANKNGTQYRYYVSQNLVRGERADPTSTALRLPAGDLERLVQQRLAAFLGDAGAIYQATLGIESDGNARWAIVHAASALADRWEGLATTLRRAMLARPLVRIDVRRLAIELTVRPDAIPEIADPAFGRPVAGCASTATEPIVLSIPARLKRLGREVKLVIDGLGDRARQPDRALLRVLAQAHRYRERLLAGQGRSMQDIADEVGVGRSYFSRIVRLGFLAPDIVEVIMKGRQPPTLTAEKLSLGVELPADWADQKALLGID